ncbi:efflux RND transporter periplasmic adaptor subunit [Acuticoccus sediminis]|nr:efflux RND transporter periplasmic adaptor subunit [Acuticoccus sediminis]
MAMLQRCLTVAVICLIASGARAETLECLIEPDLVIELATPVEGVIDEMVVDRGDRVDAGDVVARLDSQLERIAVEMAKEKAEDDSSVRASASRLLNQTRTLERTQTLFERRTVPQATLEEAQMLREVREIEHSSTERQLAMAQVELKRAETVLERRAVKSPIAGVVLERLLQAGEYAHEQANIARIARIDPLRIEVFAPIRLFASVKVGDPVTIHPIEPVGGSYVGKVDVVDQVFDPASGTFGVRITLPNPGEKIPSGLRCTADFAPDS